MPYPSEIMLAHITILIVTYIVWKLLRWACAPRSPIDNLHGPPARSWLAGHLPQLYDKQGWAFHHELHARYGPVSRLQGMLGQPMLCVYDPLAMHSIVLKDQHVFEEMQRFLKCGALIDRGLSKLILTKLGIGYILSQALTLIIRLRGAGETHRKQRKLLNPVFSTKNLRRLTPVFYEVVGRLKNAIKARVDLGASDVDMAQYMGRAALEVVGKATLGHSFDPLTEERHDPYAEAVKSFVPVRRPLMNLLPSRRVKRFLNVVDTMHSSAVMIYSQRQREAAALGYAPEDDEKAKDLITILLRANAGASEEDMLPEDELIAQLSILVFVATDTSSNALTLIFERLAEHPHVQDRLRAEVVEARRKYEGGQIPYDDLMSLPYLDAVVRETLRVNVPAQLRLREARADAILPLSKPVQGRDGSLIESIPVPNGTVVFVAIQASNVSEDLWGPDAREWRPERWLEPLPETVTEASIPGVYSNLGFKFSQLEIKSIIAELLPMFMFERTDVPVVWNLAEVVHPTVGIDSSRPAYPMKVTLVNGPSGVGKA
ncbi:hypothetical protein BN946_scf184998.g48 [Trametes cinnabarina]|uniref:Cytochrome P450 n=1 Tax=Pycnoporus cinnabarinus TaxID=5643 RepID=A0A060S2Y6_PYCCI|nr:hypothetical protein BN946_scf184998.g48 [Trametes cinnabarina]